MYNQQNVGDLTTSTTISMGLSQTWLIHTKGTEHGKRSQDCPPIYGIYGHCAKKNFIPKRLENAKNPTLNSTVSLLIVHSGGFSTKRFLGTIGANSPSPGRPVGSATPDAKKSATRTVYWMISLPRRIPEFSKKFPASKTGWSEGMFPEPLVFGFNTLEHTSKKGSHFVGTNNITPSIWEQLGTAHIKVVNWGRIVH